MIKFDYFHKKWVNEPGYRKEYEALEEEFALIATLAKARERAGRAAREWTRQAIGRTLARFAKATGHKLKISLEPVKKERGRGVG